MLETLSGFFIRPILFGRPAVVFLSLWDDLEALPAERIVIWLGERKNSESPLAAPCNGSTGWRA